MASEVQQLRDRIHREGYDTRKTPDGHWEVLTPKGDVVRYRGGTPLRFPSTPSDPRGLKNAVAQLREAGVLPQPAARVVKRDNGRGEVLKLKRTELKVYSDALRGEVVALMEKGNLTQADIYHFADRWAAEHGIPVPSHPQGVMSKFLSGNMLSNLSYRYMTAAVSAIKRNDGVIPEMERAIVQEKNEPKEIEVETSNPGYKGPVKLPQLALDTMQMIYKDEKDHDAIMALVQDIARLEQG